MLLYRQNAYFIEFDLQTILQLINVIYMLCPYNLQDNIICHYNILNCHIQLSIFQYS